MEKQRICSEFKCFRRLLIIIQAIALIFIAESPVFSAKVKYSQIIKTLLIKPAEETNFTSTEVLFTVMLPYISSNDIQIEQPEVPDGVRYKSIRKSQFYTDEGGVNLDIWFNFEEPGTYTLPSLNVRINEWLYHIPFASVKIEEHPQKILPRMIFRFEDGKEAVFTRNKIFSKPELKAVQGKAMKFSVYLQHAVQIVSFNTFVPKNGIFTELKRYDISNVNPKGNEYSKDYIPVGDFSWIPLDSGKQTLPMIQIMATAYNGDRIELYTPDIFAVVQKNDVNLNKSEVNEKNYEYAFVEFSEEKIQNKKIILTDEDCKNIALLRSKERHSSPFSSAKKDRQLFEQSLGFGETSDEPIYFNLILWLSITLVFLICSVVFIFLRKIWISISALVVFVTFLVFSIVCGIHLNVKEAVLTNGKLRNVPEKSVDSIPSIDPGTVVEIIQKAGDWCFVQYGNTNGWTTSENLLCIE